LRGTDSTGLVTCISDPANFDSSGCVRLSRTENDRDQTEWRQDPPIILDTWTIPLPKFGFGIGLPNRFMNPVVPSTGRTEDYGVIELGFFDVQRLYRQNILDIKEVWTCACSKITRSITCTGDWTETDLVKKSGFGTRFYQKSL
jgi:hypothetical protein